MSRYPHRCQHLSESQQTLVSASPETGDRSRPEKDANWHDFPVTRDDAFGLAYDRDQHAPIGAPSLAASPETADRGRPQQNAQICAFSEEQLAQLLNGSKRNVQQHGRSAADPTSALSVEPCLPAAESETPLYPSAARLTASTLCDWIATSLPGERVQYHEGLLLLDRSATTSPYPPKERLRIQAVAKRAWRACELGLVHLVSQRVEPYVFRYLAVRARMTPKASEVRQQLRTRRTERQTL
jgi:hypothetical protein